MKLSENQRTSQQNSSDEITNEEENNEKPKERYMSREKRQTVIDDLRFI